MKKFIEKLIGRLEEIKSDNFVSAVLNEPYSMGICHTIEKSIEIVNQLAEEYKDNVMINGQYCWQTCGATEHCKECNRLCNGSIDYYENYDVLAAEYNNGWIPCSERLPEEGQIVLANVKNPSKYINKGTPIIITEYEDAYFWHNGIIQAWQPLPAPYTPPTNSEIPNWQQQTMNRFERVE